jgi:tetratricopeptide (TPR) repeat protein
MILLGSFALRDVDRLADWRDEFTFLRVTLRDAPRAHVIQNRMANYLLGDLGDLEGAKEAYNAEVVRDPNFLNVRYSLASSLLKKGEFVEAYNSTLLLSALKPDWVPALIIAAEAAGRIGRTDYAKALLEKSLSLEPDHALVHNHMGNVAFLEGKFREAIKWWERSAELDPSNVQVLFNLALGYEKVGENERAIAYYRRFSGKAPPEMGQTLQRARSKIEELSRKR